jgi:hypothetical protein
MEKSKTNFEGNKTNLPAMPSPIFLNVLASLFGSGSRAAIFQWSVILLNRASSYVENLHVRFVCFAGSEKKMH